MQAYPGGYLYMTSDHNVTWYRGPETSAPTMLPTPTPTSLPTQSPTFKPTSYPTVSPTPAPTPMQATTSNETFSFAVGEDFRTAGERCLGFHNDTTFLVREIDGIDTGFVEIPLGFNLSIGEDTYTSVFVSSNTYFTFGSGSYKAVDGTSSIYDLNMTTGGIFVGAGDHVYYGVGYEKGADYGLDYLHVRVEGSAMDYELLFTPSGLSLIHI